MASEEHKLLAAYIKGVHQSLRVQSRAVGPDKAWLEHCKQTDVLEVIYCTFTFGSNFIVLMFLQHMDECSLMISWLKCQSQTCVMWNVPAPNLVFTHCFHLYRPPLYYISLLPYSVY